MKITREQFRQLAPKATLTTVDDLFALNSDGQPHIDRALAEHEITEPDVVAQFLACASLASEGFTKFESPVPGVAPADWLAAMARKWLHAHLTEDAGNWDWPWLVEVATDRLGITEKDWSVVFARLRAVCEALGVEDRSEEFALSDRGASEM